MIDHLSLGVSELPAATSFYDAVLRPLGYCRVWTRPHAAGYGFGGPDEQLALFEVGDDANAPGRGFHIAFRAPHRDAVIEFHRAAVALGAIDEGEPGPRPRFGAGYFAAFVRDPDGHKLEAVFHDGREDRCGDR